MPKKSRHSGSSKSLTYTSDDDGGESKEMKSKSYLSADISKSVYMVDSKYTEIMNHISIQKF